jgi:hypothetical protein
MGRRIASQSKQTVRGGPKPAKEGLLRRLRHCQLSNIFFEVDLLCRIREGKRRICCLGMQEKPVLTGFLSVIILILFPCPARHKKIT